MEKVYKTTKEQCQKEIDKLSNVCDRCGREIVPLETEDNGGSPTFWAGCLHGTDSGVFTSGVKKEIFELARKLVLDGERMYYSLGDKSEFSKTLESRTY